MKEEEESPLAVTHVTPSMDLSMGGPTQCLADLANALLSENHKLSLNLITTNSRNPIFKSFAQHNGNMIFLDKSEDVTNVLSSKKHDVLHGHGLWTNIVHKMARYARKNKIPYIITVHGMLDTWSINHKKWKKKIGLVLFQRKDLRGAAVLHATSESEATNIRTAGFTNPLAVIPNGVELFPVKKVRNEEFRTILFMARLVKNKGIEELLKSWSLVDQKISEKWKLVIAGEGTSEYSLFISEIIRELGLKNVELLGPKYGEEKLCLFSESSLFVLPTYTENFGVVIAEALAAEIPVITTTGAPWKQIVTENAGWQIELSESNLTNTLSEALQKDDFELNSMGKNGRKIIESEFSSVAVAKKMVKLYKWLENGGQKPDFVT